MSNPVDCIGNTMNPLCLTLVYSIQNPMFYIYSANRNPSIGNLNHIHGCVCHMMMALWLNARCIPCSPWSLMEVNTTQIHHMYFPCPLDILTCIHYRWIFRERLELWLDGISSRLKYMSKPIYPFSLSYPICASQIRLHQLVIGLWCFHIGTMAILNSISDSHQTQVDLDSYQWPWCFSRNWNSHSGIDIHYSGLNQCHSSIPCWLGQWFSQCLLHQNNIWVFHPSTDLKHACLKTCIQHMAQTICIFYQYPMGI